MWGFCLTCRVRVDVIDPESIRDKNGKLILKGFCPNKCGQAIYRISNLPKVGKA